MEGHVANAASLGLVEIDVARKAPIGGGLSWRLFVKSDMALQHWQQPLAICRIARLDHNVED